MSYATLQDLIDRGWERELVELTDKTNRPASTINETTVERALTDASVLIDSYLGKLYRLPLSSVPPVVTKFACDLARYQIYDKAAEEGTPVYIAWQTATKWLENVAKGLVTLDVEGVTPAQAGSGQVQTSAPIRVFSRHSLRHL